MDGKTTVSLLIPSLSIILYSPKLGQFQNDILDILISTYNSLHKRSSSKQIMFQFLSHLLNDRKELNLSSKVVKEILESMPKYLYQLQNQNHSTSLVKNISI